MCWIAPLMPQAMYRSGAIRVPVWPTCWACGRQPAEVTTRDTPTVPPSSAASSSSSAKPSALPTPRPPPTTTRASASEIRPASAGTREVIRTRKSRSARSGWNDWTATGAGPLRPSARARTRAARRSAGPCRPRAPPPRAGCRPSAGGSPATATPGRTSVQFAASGRPDRAATWASTSAPRSLPGPMTAARSLALDELGDGLADRLGRVVGQPRVLDDVEDRHAGRREAARDPRGIRRPRRRRASGLPVAPASVAPSVSASLDRRSGAPASCSTTTRIMR